MRHIIILMFTYLLCPNGYSQDVHGMDIIFVINEGVVERISSPTFVVKNIAENRYDTIHCTQYYPGYLGVVASDFEYLSSVDVDSIRLTFTHGYFEKNNVVPTLKHYEIDFRKYLINDYYTVIYLYDLNIRKYKRLYVPQYEGRNYVVEFHGGIISTMAGKWKR